MDLLVLLASRPREVITREEFLNALWPDVVVGDDTLARCVFKLRRAFGDDPKSPAYVETVSKRGYRLIAAIEPVVETPLGRTITRPLVSMLAAAVLLSLAGVGGLMLANPGDPSATLVTRAKDSYFQFTRAENETAISLYERVLAVEPDNAQALAGLAAALVQQVIRWPNGPGDHEYTRTTLGEALTSGRTTTPTAVSRLSRARALAERAVRLSPNDYFAHQALGLTRAAAGNFVAARVAQERAVELNPDAWGALINLGDLEDIEGRAPSALPFYERAYEAMERAYSSEPQRIRLWQGALGTLIGDRYRNAGRVEEAEAWYLRVLVGAPLNPEATSRLAALRAARGERSAARQLCGHLIERTGANPECERLIALMTVP